MKNTNHKALLKAISVIMLFIATWLIIYNIIFMASVVGFTNLSVLAVISLIVTSIICILTMYIVITALYNMFNTK